MIVIFLLCAVICSAGVIKMDRFADKTIPQMTKPVFEEGWIYQIGARQGTVDCFPFVEKGKEEYLILTTELPHLDGGEFLSFSNQYNSCQVFVDGVKIYDYGEALAPPFGSMLGNMSSNVPLKSQYSGKRVSIRLEKKYDFANYKIQEMLLGSGSEIRFYYAKTNVGVLACTLLMLLLSLAMFVLYLLQKSKRFKYDYRLFLHLGMVSFIGAIWIFTDSLLPQFLFGNTILITVLSFWSFMAMPIPVINLVEDLCRYGKKALRIAEKAILFNMIGQTLLYMLSVMDFPQMLPITHTILVFSLICIVYALVRDSKSRQARFTNDILFAILVLVFFGVAALVNFYVTGSSNNNSLYYRLGILLFVILLILVNIKRMGVFLDEWEQNRVLSKLAFMDIMTKTGNRSAYERFLSDKADFDVKGRNLSLVLLDLNDLKQINDIHGHDAGDQVLVDAARCIKTIFKDVGDVYRIGGDEFLVIIEGSDVDGHAYREKLRAEIEKNNLTARYPFTLAFGFASAREDDCGDLKELQKKADLNMYADKQKYKA